MAVDLARVAAVIDRIATDVDELARARRVQDLNTAAVLPDPRGQNAAGGLAEDSWVTVGGRSDLERVLAATRISRWWS